MWEAGINVLAIDYRNHGKSGDTKQTKSGKKVILWGTAEYRDPLAAAEWLNKTKGFSYDRIGILGASMGAATALVAGAKEPRIKGVWADSPVCDAKEVLLHGTKKFGGGIAAGVAGPITDWAIGVGESWMDPAVKEDWINNAPFKMVKTYQTDQSIQLVSAAGDNTVPAYIVDRCATDAKTSGATVDYWAWDDVKDHNTQTANKEFKTNEFDTHVQAMLYETDEYGKRLVGFFNRTLSGVVAKCR
jgi:dienelactone hydrolase